ncbi:MAG: hypothetical protein H7Y38_18480 [Armatimonadetes bacterium]|nr:hypothetical protein [Armatimonadota bacterium]
MSTPTLTTSATLLDVLPKPKTHRERLAVLDAMLDELRESEARAVVSNERSKQVWREIDALSGETRAILSDLRRRRGDANRVG